MFWWAVQAHALLPCAFKGMPGLEKALTCVENAAVVCVLFYLVLLIALLADLISLPFPTVGVLG